MAPAWSGLGLVVILAAGPQALAQAEDQAPPVAPGPAGPRPYVVVPGPPGPHVEDPRKLPETPPSAPDLAYDSRLLSSAASAEQFQGRLDGGWTLAAKGRDLYAFELVDNRDALEGAWRDLRRSGEPAASGVLEKVERAPPGLVLRFTPTGAAAISVALGRDLRGELEQGGTRVAVTMRKTSK
jgi:hypothetical protein